MRRFVLTEIIHPAVGSVWCARAVVDDESTGVGTFTSIRRALDAFRPYEADGFVLTVHPLLADEGEPE